MAVLTRRASSRLVLVAAFSAAALRTQVGAQATPPTEYEVKAAFLYNFARFVHWPSIAFEGKEGTFVIAILGADPFGHALERLLSGKTVGGRQLEIRRFASANEVQGCQMLFISAALASQVSETLEIFEKRPILTVSDIEEFVERGGAIELMIVENKVRFAINLSAARASALEISSQLLKLATRVINAD
jgi:hypothetical protein